MRLIVGIDARQHHRIGFGGLDLHGLLEPVSKQAQGIVRCAILEQSVTGVIAAQIGNVRLHQSFSIGLSTQS